MSANVQDEHRKCRPERPLLDDAGVTLSELMIVIALMTIVVFAAYMLLEAVQVMSAETEARSAASDQTRIAMDRITRELRQAQEVVEGAGGFDLNLATDMRFFADIDGDSGPERIRYWVPTGGSVLLRTVEQPSSNTPPYVTTANPWGTPSADMTICSLLDTSAALFRYYDRSDAIVATGTVHSISAVQVRLRNGATVSRRTAYVLMESWLTLRAVNSAVDP